MTTHQLHSLDLCVCVSTVEFDGNSERREKKRRHLTLQKLRTTTRTVLELQHWDGDYSSEHTNRNNARLLIHSAEFGVTRIFTSDMLPEF
jgi:hypothetical protein